jgi:hypothetical protein
VDTFRRFNAVVAEILWYYRPLAGVLTRRLGTILSGELAVTVDELAGLAARDSAAPAT